MSSRAGRTRYPCRAGLSWHAKPTGCGSSDGLFARRVAPVRPPRDGVSRFLRRASTLRVEIRSHGVLPAPPRVGLDLCPGNGSNQYRIGDDDSTDEGREQADYHARVAGRLDDDLVIGLEPLGELQ